MQLTKHSKDKTNKQKISFFAAMLIVMGSSIGAGIFYKSESVIQNSGSSIILAIFAWVIASCAVVAMGLALIEIASARNDNLSLIGWIKKFNSRTIFKASKNFMVYIYLPLSHFFVPLYVILSFQDGIGALLNVEAFKFNTNYDWIIWTLISLLMTTYFTVVPALYLKVGNWQNKILLLFKFIPIVFVIILGFILVATNKGGSADVSWTIVNSNKTIAQGASITQISGIGPAIGLFVAIAAVFFAYDGFYVAAGVQSEMKEPKKTPLALFIGLGVITIIYLSVAIAMSINGGSFSNMRLYMEKLVNKKFAQITFGLINISLALGVLGIVNAFAMWAPRFIEDLLAEGELPLWQKLARKINPKFPKIGVIYTLVISLPIILIFSIIGALAYIPSTQYYVYSDDKHLSMARLYAFADLLANWVTVLTFAFISASFFGAIRIRKKRGIVQNRLKFFLPVAWFATIIVFISLIASIIVPIIDLFLLIGVDKVQYYNSFILENNVLNIDMNSAFIQLIVSRVLLVLVLIILSVVIFMPTLIEDRIIIKKFKSLEAYEKYKQVKLFNKN